MRDSARVGSLCAPSPVAASRLRRSDTAARRIGLRPSHTVARLMGRARSLSRRRSGRSRGRAGRGARVLASGLHRAGARSSMGACRKAGAKGARSGPYDGGVLGEARHVRENEVTRRLPKQCSPRAPGPLVPRPRPCVLIFRRRRQTATLRRCLLAALWIQRSHLAHHPASSPLRMDVFCRSRRLA